MRKNKPSISIILPVYGVEEWIEETIISIQGQSFQDWEAIFVIDGSKDRSEEIVREYSKNDNRLIVINQENKGQGAARDNGVRNANGEYFIFLDPDDIMPPNALEVAYSKAKKLDLDVVVGDIFEFRDKSFPGYDAIYVSDGFKEVFNKLPVVFTSKDVSPIDFHYSIYFMISCLKLIKTEIWLDNEIKSPHGITMGEDLIAIRKLFLVANRVSFAENVFVCYRRRENSATTKKSIKAFGIFKSFYAMKSVYKELEIKNPDLTLMHASYLTWFYLHMMKFTPFVNWGGFYKETVHVVSTWKDIDDNYLRPFEKRALKILIKNNIFLLPLYIFTMMRFDSFVNSFIVKILHIFSKFSPVWLLKILVNSLDSLIDKSSNEGKEKLQKIKFHLLVKKNVK